MAAVVRPLLASQACQTWVLGARWPVSAEQRDQYWDQLHNHIHSHKERSPLLIVGDLNSQLLEELQDITGAVGPHFQWDKTQQQDEEENTMAGPTNQSQLRDLIDAHDLCVQLDHALIHKAWRNLIHDVDTAPEAALNSNHFLVKITFKVRTKASQRKPAKPRRVRNPTQEQIACFNAHLTEALHNHSQATTDTPDTRHQPPLPLIHTPTELWAPFRQAAAAALESCIPEEPPRQKHPWITDATWTLIQQRAEARSSQRWDLESELHKSIRKQARKDKASWLKARLLESEAALDPRDKWRWIKRVRSDYKPRTVSIKNAKGHMTSQSQQAQTFADYLRDEHWAPPQQDYTGPTAPIWDAADINVGPISIREYQDAVAGLANNKAPGPDGLPAEAWKWLTAENQQALLKILNRALLTGQVPHDWLAAIVVEIYKGKGSLTDPSSYRPISLLNTAYKLLAKILHLRLQRGLDHRLRDTQFGFRANRSTSQPIHILRRQLERAEATGNSLYVVLLDWEKAFDKIHPQALHTALTRYGVPHHLTNLISNIYTAPQFNVSAAGHTSSTATASSGIRQGCPLSPYLFLIVHSMIMHDVDVAITANGQNLPWLYSQNQAFYDLAFADDTALMSGTAAKTEQLLHAVQTTAAHSNLRLNVKKCMLLRSPASSGAVHFTDGTPVQQVDHAKYLGVILSSDSSSHRDVVQRIAKARKNFNALHSFWRHADISRKWKLRIYNAVFVPLLTYGMESAALTQSDLHRLEAFHSQCLRKICRIGSTYFTEEKGKVDSTVRENGLALAFTVTYTPSLTVPTTPTCISPTSQSSCGPEILEQASGAANVQ
ncbi:Pol [Symbiodinium natans]|uniref:Pol protein n=1 Tax=Symbiodinium natans TaxID=878477 RepID=A0A812M7M3_9DINO|nr:Pol [Symbiodinium natans]